MPGEQAYTGEETLGRALQRVPVKWGKTTYGRIFSKTLEEHGEMWFILILLIV